MYKANINGQMLKPMLDSLCNQKLIELVERKKHNNLFKITKLGNDLLRELNTVTAVLPDDATSIVKAPEAER